MDLRANREISSSMTGGFCSNSARLAEVMGKGSSAANEVAIEQ